MPRAAFREIDFETLEALASAASGTPGTVSPELRASADATWETARQLVRQSADAAGRPGLDLKVWPWRDGDTLFPFVWARLKSETDAACAAHVGVFLSTGGCNCAVDLEKDELEAGTSREGLDQVHAFFRETGRRTLAGLEDPRIRVWTDDGQVLPVETFLLRDYEAFLAAGTDADHSWPRIGYRFGRGEMTGAPDAQVGELAARIDRLLPVYEALVASYGTER